MKTLFIVAAAFAASATAAFGQVPQFDLDHFKCYIPIEATPVQPAPVQLLDQFGQFPAVVGNIFRLCNPTEKLHNDQLTPIKYPDDHLTLHQLNPQPLIDRRVKIRNQFGEQVILTHEARFLAVPTQKSPHGPPQKVNHFTCYAAEGQDLNEPVGLKDQFFASKHRIRRPVLFCNPAQKWHAGMVSPVANPNDHLTCYAMTRVQYLRDVDIRDQFGKFHLQTEYADMACVPTQKLAWEVID